MGKGANPSAIINSDAISTTGEAALIPAGSAFAPGAGSTFSEAWIRRVAEVDDSTLSSLMRLLVQLRRLKHGLAASAFVAGAFMFGHLDVANPVYALLLYGTLAGVTGVPTLAIGSLTVRQLFLREAERMGLSRSTALLLLTRAERRARFLSPWQRTEKRIRLLSRAVRSWDEA